MGNIQVLIVNDDEHIRAALNTVARDAPADDPVLLETLDAVGAEHALELTVAHNPNLCLIRVRDDFSATHTILDGLKEAGLKVPVILIAPPGMIDQEDRLVARGAKGMIPDDGALGSVLRYIIRRTHDLKMAENRLRADREHLLAQILDLRDGRERAEEQSIQYLEIAEELALAKEHLERLDQEKNKFFSIIAHDLRSPFTALLGYTAMLAQMSDKLSSAEISRFARNAHNSSSNIYRLVENLLEWARLQMSRIDYTPSQEDLRDIALQTIDVLMPVAKAKGLTLKCRLDSESAFVDPHMIDTVIRNLVNNAIKFTREGKITIFAETTPDHIAVSVRDSGIGMSPEKSRKIFSIAEDVSSEGTDGEPGTGLGILLCKELVERGGGHLRVVSELGRGSTFTFTVPRTPKDAPTHDTPHDKACDRVQKGPQNGSQHAAPPCAGGIP